MNRTEPIEAISADTGMTRQQADAVTNAFVYAITSTVRSGDAVRMTGLGTFKLRVRTASSGCNLGTGADVQISASKGIGFTPGVKLRQDLHSH